MPKEKLDKILKDYDNHLMSKEFSSTARRKEIFFNAARKNDEIQFQKYRNKPILLLTVGGIIIAIVIAVICIIIVTG
ncbi:MAG: hypothetical protein WCS27_00365 [Victivallaceae bacterium]